MTQVILGGAPQVADPQTIDYQKLYEGTIETQSRLGTAPECSPDVLKRAGKSQDEFTLAVNAKKIARRKKAVAMSSPLMLSEQDSLVDAAQEKYSAGAERLAAVREREPWRTEQVQHEVDVLHSELTSAREKRNRREYDAREVLDRTADPAIGGTLWYLDKLKQAISETNNGHVIDDGYVPPRDVPVKREAFVFVLEAIDSQIAELQKLKHDPAGGIA